MESVNTLRVVLVAGAVLAALLAAIYGYWDAAVLLLIGVGAHAALWLRLRRPGATGDAE